MPAHREDPLDERLVRVALALLADEGPERLTMRRIARRAGVSHGAPLRHFASLADLLAEVAAVGFRMLSEAIEKSGAQLPPGSDPVQRLEAASRAYVEIAVANPALFGLMFRPHSLDVRNEAFARESTGAFEHLVHYVRAAQDAGWKPDLDTRLLAGVAWSHVHGLASLWAQGAFSGVVPYASLEQAIEINQELVHGDQRGGTK